MLHIPLSFQNLDMNLYLGISLLDQTFQVYTIRLIQGLCGGDADFTKDARGANFFKNEYNDLETPYDETILKQLLDGGVDELLALHYAHLFVRDPLVIFQELLDVDDLQSADHFEVILTL
jgi:hypothetical protein